MKFRTLYTLIIFGIFILGITITTEARNKEIPQKDGFQKTTEAIHPNESILDVNNMTTWVTEDGYFHWSDNFSNVNGSFPKGTAGVVFAQGMLWGGKVNDGDSLKIRVNGSTYANGLDAGKVLYDGSGNVTGPDTTGQLGNYHVWRVHRDWDGALDYRSAASQFFGKPIDDVTQSNIQDVKDQYEYDWNNWPAELGAPYEDVNGDGQYDPNTDIPGYPGATQTIWIVANDLGPGDSQRSYGSPPIGIEMQMTLWGYNFSSSSPLGNITFNRTRLIYTGKPGGPSDATIDSMFVVQWADPDVGTYSDDYAGSDTSRSLGFAYNGNTQDDTYLNNFGISAPAVGWDFFQGPVANNDTLGMSSFGYFAAGSAVSDPDLGEYAGTLQWYNLMRGFLPRPEYPQGEPWVNPVTGEETKFVLTGDPVTGKGWIDGMELPPGDRRILLSTGPFSMAVGDTQDIVVAQIGAIGKNNTSSVSVLRFYDQFAQYAYDNGFQLPSPPPSPSVSVTPLDKSIVLNWGSNYQAVQSTEQTVSQGFEFEGYNVYQLPSATAQLSDGTKIATYDKANLVGTILDDVLDSETGFVVEQPVQNGTNEGIQRFHTITRDAVRNRPLSNGVTYYFAVTAYSYLENNAGSPFKTLESAPVVVSVQPQPQKPGVTNFTGAGSMLTSTQTAGTGDATIHAEVVDPAKLTDSDWKITFNNSPESWNLVQDNSTVLQNQPFTMMSDQKITSGIQVNVLDVTFAAPTTILAHEQIEGDGLSLWGDGTLFGNATGYYAGFTGQSAPTADQASPDLEFRFTGNGGMESATTDGGQLATYWGNAAFGEDDSLDEKGIDNKTIRMPFELWDIENDRQLNYAVIGRNADGNSPWGDGAGDYYRMDARDYIVVLASEYDESAINSNGTYPTDDDNTWILFFEQGGASEWSQGDVYRVQFANPVTGGQDVFEFSTTKPDTGVTDTLEAQISDINVFPNPYYGFHRLETGRFNKYVTFTHLPNEATIRIFNLAGIMVTKLEHNSNSQFERWDLTNADDLPVASGIYIAHISSEYGEKVLKMAIIQEEQVLQRY